MICRSHARVRQERGPRSPVTKSLLHHATNRIYCCKSIIVISISFCCDIYTGVCEPLGVLLGEAVLDLIGRMSVLSTLVVLFFGLGAAERASRIRSTPQTD
jgi:hypothetical protein